MITLIRMILNFLFPKKCFACQRRGDWLCHQCLTKTIPRQRQYCSGCQQTSLSGITHQWCRKKTILDGVLTLFPYQPPLKQIMKTYKYQMARQLSDIWKIIIKKGLKKHGELSEFWQKEKFTIVPIPLFPARLRWRGFNQAQAIGEHIGNQIGLPLADNLIVRQQWTRSQAKLDRQSRKHNLNRAFSLKTKASLYDRNFVIFDDILTTGQTIKAVGQVLKKNGAGQVWGLAMLG